jgi:hypothetical protein
MSNGGTEKNDQKTPGSHGKQAIATHTECSLADSLNRGSKKLSLVWLGLCIKWKEKNVARNAGRQFSLRYIAGLIKKEKTLLDGVPHADGRIQ